MKRRTLIAALGGAVVSPAAAVAQTRRPVIGYLSARSIESDGHLLAAFRSGLKEQGYVEGENVTIDFRWAEGHFERLPAMAVELVRGNPDVLVTVGAIPSPFAAKAATSTIPIVFIVGTDPVAVGLVQSIGRPGGNMTGATLLASSLEGKRLELIHDMLPAARSVALLSNPSSVFLKEIIRDAHATADALGLRLQMLSAANASEIDRAFDAIASSKPDAFAISLDGLFLTQRAQILARASAARLPAIYPYREFADTGGLASYAAPLPAQHRAVGVYAGRILKGARPGDLPIQQPTTYELVLNLKTARTLGLALRPAFLARADDTIE
jgi:putative ABC transport system substrate-binding protein